MKSFIKNNKVGIIASLALVAAISAWAAISTTVYSPASGRVSITTAPAVSSTFTFQNTNAARNATVYVYDAPSTNVSYVVGAYSNYTFTAGYVTNSWTNYMGVVNSNIYTAVITTTNSIAATTNFYPLAGIFIVTSNTSPGLGVLTAPFAYTFRYGIFVTNDFSVSATATYGQ